MSVAARINLVTLGVADVARAREFYERLGWQASSASNESVTFLHSTSAVLALYGREALAEDAGVASESDGFAGVTLATNYNSEAEVDAAFGHAVACGAKAVKQPVKAFWGGYSGYYADLDGHLWEVAFNPFMPLDANGNMTLP
ncbi:VOC family protein [Aeoliella sp. SH292]|uniref:VOC family protein n=1 Tax=Aeoliella sp. SH292 TaxID=3454464 RepID=UPI003F9E3FB9